MPPNPPEAAAPAPAAGGPPPPRGWYDARAADAAAAVDRLEARMARLATFRLLAFVGLVAPLLALETTPRGAWPLLFGAAGLLGAAFVALVVVHRRARRRRDRASLRGTLAGEGLARLERRWDALPLPDLGAPPPAEHAYAGDLDVLGRGSLAHLLGTPRTDPGRARLRAALVEPGDPRTPEARALREARRGAVAVLASHPERLEAVQLAARTVSRPSDPAGLAAFRSWATAPGWSTPAGRARALLGVRVLSVVNLVLLVGWFSGWPPFWIGGAALSLVIWARVRTEAHRRFEAVEGAEASLGRWAELLEVAAALPPGSPHLDRLREGAQSPVEGAAALASLARISDWAQLRRSSLAYFPVALLLAWDVHPLVPMERWRERFGDRVEGWLEAVGELELVTALALLQFDHPEWVLPEEHPGHEEPPNPSIHARDLRHPLLPPDRAVGNDLELPGPGALLLVTGSNMSGKSTLLRALGVNQVLLLAGGPVAAAAYRAPPLVPWSSMRIRDSLADGVSFFMAELQRLRRVVDAARARSTLVLLDEILQGTNTAERRTAARIILGHLLEAGAVGAVSTHDLTLADAPELAPRLVQVHLREEVGEVDGVRNLAFDHRLRPGPATSRNALLLLEIVGLGGTLPDDDPDDEG
jgi:hypothetical protein